MTIELRPMGTACNLGCTYCYQEPIREANGNRATKYDRDVILEEARKTGQPFSLFGGEALLVPKKDLEYFFKHGYEWYGRNSVQSNGVLIDDDHIEMFKKYNVSVGISIDGPEELNGLREVRRQHKNDKKTREATDKTINNIRKLKDNGISVGIIVTLHRENGTGERLDKLMDFIERLGDIGIMNGNIHTLEVDPTMPDQEIHVLSQEENLASFKKLADFFEDRPHLRWAPFNIMKDLVRGEDQKAMCTWKNCDPWNTSAVYGIEGNGDLSNCGRTNKEGIDWYKADDNAYARYISFYFTPDEMGGCQGCRFWSLCGGSCPGEAENGDFRNKTIHCHTQYGLLEHYEEKLVEQGEEPITLTDDMKHIDHIMLEQMQNGRTITVKQAKNRLKDLLSNPVSVPVR